MPLPSPADLHAAIMNLPCKFPETFHQSDWTEYAYKIGHRDARHAAAELALAAVPVAQPEQQDSVYLTSAGPSEGLQTALREARYRDALVWAMGAHETDGFRERYAGDGPYWWRTELAKRAGLRWGGEKYIEDEPIAGPSRSAIPNKKDSESMTSSPPSAPLAQPAQEPVASAIVSGALFDFMGMLTTQDEETRFAGHLEATTAVEMLKRFAAKRNFNLEPCDVPGWRKSLAAPAPSQREVRMLGFELDGVITDVEQGGGFDAVCLETIKRVRADLAAMSAGKTGEQS